MSTYTLHQGDCLDVLRTMEDSSVDAIVTDPPYGLTNTDPAHVTEAIIRWAQGDRAYTPEGRGFMGAAWDAFVPPPALWDECLRVLKPGGHMVVFAGSRTQDLMGLSIRLAGFDLRDSVAWLYGSGFPKSLDVSKAIDKAAGADRAVIGTKSVTRDMARNGRTGDEALSPVPVKGATLDVTAPATPEAERWQGWGTALKPAYEPIILARKPLPGTVAANVQEWGTGALNIDATRIGTEERPLVVSDRRSGNQVYGDMLQGSKAAGSTTEGRWPANVILDEDQAAALDQQSGNRPGFKSQNDHKETQSNYFGADKHPGERQGYNDEGGASRFFYVAKAGKKERPSYVDENGDTVAHPTVKPVALMRWLVRLITPPGGTVLEPFAGTGTTGEAAVMEGMYPVMVENHPPFIPLIHQRMDRAAQVPPTLI